MTEKNMLDFREIAKIVVSYYQYPEETVKRVREEMGWTDRAEAKAVEAGGATVGEHGVREARDPRHAHEDEALPPGRGEGEGAPLGQAPEGCQARERRAVPQGAARLEDVRRVRPGAAPRGPGARGEPSQGAHPPEDRGIPRARAGEHDGRGIWLRDRGPRDEPLPHDPERADPLHPHDLRPCRGGPDLILVHALLRPPGRLPGEAREPREEARTPDRQAHLRRDVVHLRDGLRQRARRRDLQGAVEADGLRRGREGSGMDHAGHGAPRAGHPHGAPPWVAALPLVE